MGLRDLVQETLKVRGFENLVITCQSEDNRSMIDRKIYRCLVNNVTVISSEECVPQHRMVNGRLVIPMKP